MRHLRPKPPGPYRKLWRLLAGWCAHNRLAALGGGLMLGVVIGGGCYHLYQELPPGTRYVIQAPIQRIRGPVGAQGLRGPQGPPGPAAPRSGHPVAILVPSTTRPLLPTTQRQPVAPARIVRRPPVVRTTQPPPGSGGPVSTTTTVPEPPTTSLVVEQPTTTMTELPALP